MPLVACFPIIPPGTELSVPVGTPSLLGSIPVTWVTDYSGDVGNTVGPNGFSIGSRRRVSFGEISQIVVHEGDEQNVLVHLPAPTCEVSPGCPHQFTGGRCASGRALVYEDRFGLLAS